MISILSKIEDYAKAEKPIIDSKRVKYDLFPTFYNLAIAYALRRIAREDEFGVPPHKYVVALDEEGNARIEICKNTFFDDIYTFGDEKKEDTIHDTLIITKNDFRIDAKNYAMYIPEDLLYKMAVYLERNEKTIYDVRLAIARLYPNLSRVEQLQKEYEYMNNHMNNDIEQFGDTLDHDSQLDGNLERTAEAIITRMRNTDRWIKEKQAEEQEQDDYDVIPYEPRMDTGQEREYTPTGGNIEHEEVLSLPLDDRKRVLESYPAIDHFGAAITDDDEILTHEIYLYETEEGKVMYIEPINGRGRTRIIFLGDEQLTKSDVRNTAKYYLELTPEEFKEEDNTIRTNHTTIEVYANNFDCIMGTDNSKASYPIKSQVKMIKNKYGKQGGKGTY